MAMNINIEDARYENAISLLQGYVGELESVVAEYQTLNRTVSQCYETEETRQLQDVIQANINNINKSIGATNLNIERFQEIKENATTTNSALSSTFNTALSEVEHLFD
jgi:predicted component of viral defense system (DUF524 family)